MRQECINCRVCVWARRCALEGFKNSMHQIIPFYNDTHIQHLSDPINVLMQPDALTQMTRPWNYIIRIDVI